LNGCYDTILRQQQRLIIKNKVLTVLIVLVGLRLIAMIIGFILYAKGFKLPRWLDILL
jgi:hypothetical protein